jgi:hypothetical protein
LFQIETIEAGKLADDRDYRHPHLLSQGEGDELFEIRTIKIREIIKFSRGPSITPLFFALIAGVAGLSFDFE